MSYKKVFPKTALKTVDVLAAEGAFNVGCYTDNGRLVPAINSVNKLTAIHDGISAAWYSASIKKYMVFGKNIVWYSDGDMGKHAVGMVVGDTISMVETASGGLASATLFGTTAYFSLGEKFSSRPYKGAIHSCILKNGRLFGIDNSDNNKIKWSGEGGFEDWTESISGAGWTIVQNGYGDILNLVVYKDKIVAVREFGLTFFSAYGTPENYKLSYLERKLPKIYANTAAVVGDELLFYTEDGLYSYDGSTVQKSSTGLAEELLSPTTFACADGKYFLCGMSKTLQRRAVLVVDAIHDNSYLIDAQVNAVAAGDRIFGYESRQEYEFTEGGEYTFTSGEIDFSTRGFKVLKEIAVRGAKNVEIEVSNGVISRIVGGVRGKYRPNLRGKCFKITVRGSEEIKGISAVAEVAYEV
ncbi:MAG: hypothetical protein K2O89_02070 [Clostridia bacterium]|nr:hypothetical protein [Clostridia bacterium]